MELTKEEKKEYDFYSKMLLGLNLYGETTFIKIVEEKYKRLHEKKENN